MTEEEKEQNLFRRRITQIVIGGLVGVFGMVSMLLSAAPMFSAILMSIGILIVVFA